MLVCHTSCRGGHGDEGEQDLPQQLCSGETVGTSSSGDSGEDRNKHKRPHLPKQTLDSLELHTSGQHPARFIEFTLSGLHTHFACLGQNLFMFSQSHVLIPEAFIR